MGNLTPHFDAEEFACNDDDKTAVPFHLIGNVQLLAVQLEIIRVEIGVPLIVISGYRTAQHNRAVGGALHSKHLTAEAADIRPKGRTVATLHAVVLALIHAGKLRDGGIGRYRTWLHYDLGSPRRWG